MYVSLGVKFEQIVGRHDAKNSNQTISYEQQVLRTA